MPLTSKPMFKKFFGKIRNKNAKNFINFPLPTVCQDGETVLKALLPNSRIFGSMRNGAGLINIRI